MMEQLLQEIAMVHMPWPGPGPRYSYCIPIPAYQGTWYTQFIGFS